MRRSLEASRSITIPGEPYLLDPVYTPFALLFAKTTVISRRSDKNDDDPQPTSSDPVTTTKDSNDPTDDEFFDWRNDD